MTLHREEDEHLELLYHLHERHELTLESLRAHDPELGRAALEDLEREGLVALDGAQIQLTDAGLHRATQIIRRHRLAERLLADVLHLNPAEVERGACEFEHILADEITDSICTLLGHPRTCPHGSPIPEGACCRAAAREIHSAVVPLTEVPVGKWARIAYLNAGTDERLHQLAHYGVVPGSRIKLHQLRPSVVVMLEGSRLAMEQAIARDILVWRKWLDEPEAETEAETAGRGWAFWRR
jgi:DtxR family Mn-dependent transcriptional regulator